MRPGFWAAVVGGCAAGLLAVTTLVSREWIELAFGVDPDHGSGSLEWTIVAALALVAIACLWWARGEWRRAHAAVA
jgi:hypothetical protein